MKTLFILVLISLDLAALGQPYYVSPTGDDDNPGTLEKPFGSLKRAQDAVRQKPGLVWLRGGTYYLAQPLVFTPRDSGTKAAPVVYQAYRDEQPLISGGVKLEKLDWQVYRNGIFRAKVPEDLRTEEIFVNGERQVLARYPNFDPKAQYFDGFAADAISKNRAARWADPTGGYFHAMHPALWGDFTWRITGKDANGEVTKEGGWQNNRGGAVHQTIRFVENIFEELDAPGEWFLDLKTHTLYFYPPAGLDLRHATVEATRLRSLVEFRADESKPVRFVTLRGLTFRQAARTVMDTKEPLMRSDWAIYRGGAIFFEGAEDCTLEDCFLDQVGGNAIFVNNYNRRVAVHGCRIARAGANGICFVGDPHAARNPLFNYSQVNKLEDIDRTPGPKSDNYPADCLVDDCLIYLTGRVEKQTAGVEIQLAQGITIRHCSIYDMPRAGINIGDGCWGGHVIEFCDVFDTVKETGDHGSFNSWGRDRYWRPSIAEVNAWVKQAPELPRLDAVKPVILRNNRWRCDHGWDIDLDDGSSFYIITNNLCLHGGIKNREGYGRVVANNIMVNSGLHPHVWYANSGDVFRRNIVWREYQPALMPAPPWGQEMDYNLMHQEGATNGPATRLQAQSGRDEHSIVADALFVEPTTGDYRVKEGSPALALGFVNFPMNHFGVQRPALKALARTPTLPSQKPVANPGARDIAVHSWLGASIRNVADAGEMSALGLSGVDGVLVLEVPTGSVPEKCGLQKGDVVLSVNGTKTEDVKTLLQPALAAADFHSIALVISRQQKQMRLNIAPVGKVAPRPLYRDPPFDAPTDPVLCFNAEAKKWYMYYTARRATATNAPGVAWVHGSNIGMAESSDGGATWTYKGTADIRYGKDQHPQDYTYWAPEVIWAGGKYHMFLSYVPGIFTDWNHPREIVHLTSADGVKWDTIGPVDLKSDKVIDPCVMKIPDGRWRMWYKDERAKRSLCYADSPDLLHWEPQGNSVTNFNGEGPKAFHWRGKYWLVADCWRNGMRVWSSDDCLNWTMQDQTLLGSHGDVVVSGDRAWWFYFTEQGRRAAIDVVELSVVNGQLLPGESNQPTHMDLKFEREAEE